MIITKTIIITIITIDKMREISRCLIFPIKLSMQKTKRKAKCRQRGRNLTGRTTIRAWVSMQAVANFNSPELTTNTTKAHRTAI